VDREEGGQKPDIFVDHHKWMAPCRAGFGFGLVVRWLCWLWWRLNQFIQSNNQFNQSVIIGYEFVVVVMVVQIPTELLAKIQLS